MIFSKNSFTQSQLAETNQIPILEILQILKLFQQHADFFTLISK